jgi:hypothetical protein
MHAEDRRSPRRHVSRLGTRAPALPHCPRCSRSVPWCCPRSGHLPLCSSRSREGRTSRYLRRLELLSEPRPGPPRCPTGGRVELHTAPLPLRDSPPNLAPRPPESSPRRPFLFPGRRIAGARAPTAAAAWCRRPPPPAASRPPTPVQIGS